MQKKNLSRSFQGCHQMLFVWGVETLKFCIVNLYGWNVPLEVSLQLHGLIDSWMGLVLKKQKFAFRKKPKEGMMTMQYNANFFLGFRNYFCWKGFKFIQKNVVEDYISSDFQKELEVGTLQGTITYPPKRHFWVDEFSFSPGGIF